MYFASADMYIVNVAQESTGKKFYINNVGGPMNIGDGKHTFRLLHNNNEHPFKIYAGDSVYGKSKGNNRVVHVIIDETTPTLTYGCDIHPGMGDTLHEEDCSPCNACEDQTYCWWKHPGKTIEHATACDDCNYTCVNHQCETACEDFCDGGHINEEKGQTESFNFVMAHMFRSRTKHAYMREIFEGRMVKGSKAARKDVMASLKENSQESVELNITNGKHVFKRRIDVPKGDKMANMPILERSDVLTLTVSQWTYDSKYEYFSYMGVQFELFLDGHVVVEEVTPGRRLSGVSACFDVQPDCEYVDNDWHCDIAGDITVKPGCTLVGDVVAPCPEGYTNIFENHHTCDYCIEGYGGNPCDMCVNGTYNSVLSDIGTACANMSCPLGQGVVHVNEPQLTNTCEHCVNGEYSDVDGTGQCVTIPDGFECNQTLNGGCADIQDIDGCVVSCNYGNCSDIAAPGTGYICTCEEGFSGTHCDTFDCDLVDVLLFQNHGCCSANTSPVCACASCV